MIKVWKIRPKPYTIQGAHGEKAVLQTFIKNFAEKQRCESAIAKHVTDNKKTKEIKVSKS